jgi:hypothetical protein
VHHYRTGEDHEVRGVANPFVVGLLIAVAITMLLGLLSRC